MTLNLGHPEKREPQHWPLIAAADSKILTADGWRLAADLRAGSLITQPDGSTSLLSSATTLQMKPCRLVTVAGGPPIPLMEGSTLEIEVGRAKFGTVGLLTSDQIASGIADGLPLRLPPQIAYSFGRNLDVPIHPYLLGVLLGDGYMRSRSVTLCNEQAELYQLVAPLIPKGCAFASMRIGRAGTGSCDIIGTVTGRNPALDAVRTLGLAGRRAWEKSIPQPYLDAMKEDRLALLNGLLDTDGSIDLLGRIEFSSASEQLALDTLDLIHGLGGRASYAARENVMFTSPRQSSPRRGRVAHRLTGIRLPAAIPPFRRASRLARHRPARSTRQWNVWSVSPTRVCAAVAGTLVGGGRKLGYRLGRSG